MTGEDRHRSSSGWRTRLTELLLLGSLGIMICRAAYFAGPGRRQALNRGREIACIEGNIPAPRGRLLDAGDQPLAWSERRIELAATTYSELSYEERRTLFRLFPEAPREAPCIVAELTGKAQMEQLRLLLHPGSGLRLVTRTFRNRVAAEPLARKIGGCRVDASGCLAGTDGLERLYDQQLRGEAGRYEVMLDRYRNWIPRSWRLLKAPRPGRDVRLKETAAELAREK